MRRLLVLIVAAMLLAAPGFAQQNPTALKGDYKGGFKMTSGNGKFSLRLFAATQFRYTYMSYDDAVQGNTENYSNFFMRRARLWFDGNAYDPNFTYYFHLQLEPTSAVNLHDAWVAYKFNDLLTVGMGRNKVPYGTEFLASGFGLHFIDRSILSGETDITTGGGLSKWPGGTGNLGVSNEHANTGFPMGGFNLFRSQGVSLSGLKQTANNGPAFQYELGVWNGRNMRGNANVADNHLVSLRVGFYPMGWINWLFEGDVDYTESFRVGILGSAYTGSQLRNRDAAGATVAWYETDDSGYDVSVLAKYRGFGAELEWSTESFEINRNITGPTEFDREAFRAAFGYFVVPTRIEVVARYAEVQRLKDPTLAAATNSGLGVARVWNGTAYAQALEKKLTEMTAGVNFYFGAGHQHKLFFDVSLLGREFEPITTFAPDDQEDTRFRSMLQFKF